MRIKLISNIRGAWTGKVGDELDRPDVEARRLIRAGFAIELKVPSVERAVAPEPAIETATLK